jgi:hypothetical protein
MPQTKQQPLNSSGRLVVPMEISGEYTAGDAAQIPDGYMRQATNVLIRPNRVDSRPPCVLDNPSTALVTGLMFWDDRTNNQRRFVSIDAISAQKLYKKSTTTEAWDAGVTTVVTNHIPGDVTLAYTNFNGKMFFATRPVSTIGAVAFYDGTAVRQARWNGLYNGGNSSLFGSGLASFENRLYISDATAAFDNLAYIYGTAYDMTFGWTLSNATVSNLTTAAGQIISRLFPTSVSTQAVKMVANEASYTAAVLASGVDVPFTWRWDMRGTSATLTAVAPTPGRRRPSVQTPIGAPPGAIPVTLEAYIQATWAGGHVYAKGDIVTSGGFRQRATTGGTSGGGAPAFSGTFGGTVADGGVTWTNEGTDTLASQEFTVPSISEVQTWSTVVLKFSLPARTNAVNVYPRLKLWNSTYNALPTLSALDLSLKDGKTDGDPTKQNYGFQITDSAITFPFFNQESNSTALIPMSALMWTEINDDSTIRAVNTYDPQEISGRGTGVVSCGGRLVLFKRYGHWIMAPTGDPDTPVLPEGPGRVGIGALNASAISTIDDEVVFISDREVWRLKIGYEPRPICGDAMREEIMAHGATWVENDAQTDYNRALIAVNEKDREIWVYTQASKLYVYHMGDEATPAVFRPYTPEKGKWTTLDLQGLKVSSIAYNQQTGKMEVVVGTTTVTMTLIRLDPASPLQDVTTLAGTLQNATVTLVFKPVEQYAPRFDAIVESIGVFHTATASQTGQTLTAYFSTDRGLTYPHSVPLQFDPTVARIDIPAWQFGPSITLKLVYTGAIGQQVFGVSRAEAIIDVKRGEYPQVVAQVQAGANL